MLGANMIKYAAVAASGILVTSMVISRVCCGRWDASRTRLVLQKGDRCIEIDGKPLLLSDAEIPDTKELDSALMNALQWSESARFREIYMKGCRGAAGTDMVFVVVDGQVRCEYFVDLIRALHGVFGVEKPILLSLGDGYTINVSSVCASGPDILLAYFDGVDFAVHDNNRGVVIKSIEELGERPSDDWFLLQCSRCATMDKIKEILAVMRNKYKYNEVCFELMFGTVKEWKAGLY